MKVLLNVAVGLEATGGINHVIEFFWGAVETRKYPSLCDNCDYIFTTSQENMSYAIASLAVKTNRKWEHRMKP